MARNKTGVDRKTQQYDEAMRDEESGLNDDFDLGEFFDTEDTGAEGGEATTEETEKVKTPASDEDTEALWEDEENAGYED